MSSAYWDLRKYWCRGGGARPGCRASYPIPGSRLALEAGPGRGAGRGVHLGLAAAASVPGCRASEHCAAFPELAVPTWSPSYHQISLIRALLRLQVWTEGGAMGRIVSPQNSLAKVLTHFSGNRVVADAIG